MTSNISDLIKVSHRQARNIILDHMSAGIVPLLRSSPGLGKSAMLKSIATEADLVFIDHRLSTSLPEDLNGLPGFTPEGMATFKPFDIFPIEGMTELPSGKNGFLLLLDELPSARKEVQAAAYKLILDRMVGQHSLRSDSFIVAAGNRDTDRAITTPLGSAISTRLSHLELVLNVQEFIQDVVFPQQWDSKVAAFLTAFPTKLDDFNPQTFNTTFACPRTWDMAQRVAQGKPSIGHQDLANFASILGAGAASDFVAFCAHFADLPTIGQILSDPEKTPIPQDRSKKFALASLVMEHANKENFGTLFTFISRFDAEMQVMFFRSVQIRAPEIRQHPDFRKAVVQFARELYE